MNMMEEQHVNAEQISAWVDGELGAAEAARVQAWLDAHPHDAALARRWAADRDALRTAFGPALHESVPARLRDAVSRRAAPPRWALAAAAAGLLVAGALAGGAAVWQWRLPGGGTQAGADPAPQPWVQRAAFAHSVYVPEPRHAVEVKAQEEHLARWLTRRIDVPVKLFDLREHGFDLVGGRLLPDGAGKSAQLMYQDAQGLRVTVYLRKPEPGTDAAFRFEQQGEIGLFYWVEAGAGYALAGALPRSTLLALAESIYRQHPQALPPVPPQQGAAGGR
ncbi:MAG: anti-sigma factor [Rubrivivax sp.]|nr:anti-sigma factor [Rubrivivax sp.]